MEKNSIFLPIKTSLLQKGLKILSFKDLTQYFSKRLNFVALGKTKQEIWGILKVTFCLVQCLSVGILADNSNMEAILQDSSCV